jgi:hypothetical protein
LNSLKLFDPDTLSAAPMIVISRVGSCVPVAAIVSSRREVICEPIEVVDPKSLVSALMKLPE